MRADDIDLAISVAVGSFVSAQKMSIKKTLERVSRLFSIFGSVWSDTEDWYEPFAGTKFCVVPGGVFC